VLVDRLDVRYRTVGFGFVFVVLGTLAWLTSRHSEMYRDSDICSRMVIEKNPNHWQTLNNLGVSLLKKGDLDGAIDCFERGLQNAPRGSHVQKEIYVNLGHVYSTKGKNDEAIAQFEKCLSLDPNFAVAHHDLANALRRKGRYDEAITHFESALKTNPRSVLTMNNLGWILATCADPSVRNGTRAVEVAARAARLSGGEDPLILHTLAAAYAENGQFSQAVETAEHALKLAEQQRKGVLVRALPHEIALYQTDLPYHESSR
jgi:tetratricopeptide (TPR) repeat protein